MWPKSDFGALVKIVVAAVVLFWNLKYQKSIRTFHKKRSVRSS